MLHMFVHLLWWWSMLLQENGFKYLVLSPPKLFLGDSRFKNVGSCVDILSYNYMHTCGSIKVTAAAF